MLRSGVDDDDILYDMFVRPPKATHSTTEGNAFDLQSRHESMDAKSNAFNNPTKMQSANNIALIDTIVYIGHRPDPNIKGSVGYTDVYSPRIAAVFSDDTLKDEIKVLYACSQGVFENEYEFMLACKAKRRNTNYYRFGVETKPQMVSDLKLTFDRNKHVEYNIASGDKIPEMPREKFRRLYRYLVEGVFVFLLMFKRGVGDFETGAEEGHSYTKSKKPHSFQKGDDCVLNVSNVFMGTLIDYYRISSGVQGVDAQVSFMRNEQYRIAVYIHMRDVFNAFVRNNTPGKQDSTELFDGKELARMVMDILQKKLNA